MAASLINLAYEIPEGKSAKDFTHAQLDRLGLGASISSIPWGSKRVKLPPSKL